MTESLRTRLARLKFNLFPAYRFGGGRVTYVRHDWQEIHVEVSLSWRTRNYVGTIFGGSLYAAVDPIYMMMLIQTLGEEFTVWDTEAEIDFQNPGESTLSAEMEIPDSELETLRELDLGESTTRTYEVDLVDGDGTVHATVEKTLYVRRDDQ